MLGWEGVRIEKICQRMHHPPKMRAGSPYLANGLALRLSWPYCGICIRSRDM